MLRIQSIEFNYKYRDKYHKNLIESLKKWEIAYDLTLLETRSNFRTHQIPNRTVRQEVLLYTQAQTQVASKHFTHQIRKRNISWTSPFIFLC